MRNFLLQLTVCATALLASAQIQAAEPAPTNFYGLQPGKKFKLKVIQVSSTKAGLSGAGTAKIPTGIPKFSKGQTIQFEIVKGGALKGPGFSIPLKSADAISSTYTTKSTGTNLPPVAIIRKDSAMKPIFAEIVFYKISGSGFDTTTTQVAYMLE